MLEKFEKFNRRVSEGVEWIGFGALFLVVVLTCVDVVSSKLFRAPVFGALDIVILAQLIAVSCAVGNRAYHGQTRSGGVLRHAPAKALPVRH